MSFFGFDASLPRDRGHSSNAPGFAQHDAFAGLGSGGAGDDDVYVARNALIELYLRSRQH
jgi:DNA topoisomerase 2-associated protein PAT1